MGKLIQNKSFLRKKWKQVIGILLAAAVVFRTIPFGDIAVSASESRGSGLCEHHREHTAECGYVKAQECTHEHNDECYRTVTKCVHTHGPDCFPESGKAGEALPESVSGNEAASADAKQESREPENCTHVCSEESGCITEELDCHHEHEANGGGSDREGCGYVKGQPCTYDCRICPIEKLIAALPDAKDVTEDHAEEVREQLEEILALFSELTGEEQEQVDLTRCRELTQALEEGSGTTMLLTDSFTLGSKLTVNKDNLSQYNNRTLTGSTTENHLTVSGVEMNLIIRDLDLQVKYSNDVNSGLVHAGIKLENGAKLNLTLEGTNTIKGGNMHAAIEVPQGCTLTITGAGSLTAEAGEGAAGLGSAWGGSTESNIQTLGTIVINGGNITAKGSGGSAGIGGSRYCTMGTITINGGVVRAEGSSWAYANQTYFSAGIGGGHRGYAERITINGGSVTAIAGGDSAACIGAGTEAFAVEGDQAIYCCGEITVNGGTVETIGKISMGHVSGDAKGPVTISPQATLCTDGRVNPMPEGWALYEASGAIYDTAITEDLSATLTIGNAVRTVTLKCSQTEPYCGSFRAGNLLLPTGTGEAQTLKVQAGEKNWSSEVRTTGPIKVTIGAQEYRYYSLSGTIYDGRITGPMDASVTIWGETKAVRLEKAGDCCGKFTLPKLVKEIAQGDAPAPVTVEAGEITWSGTAPEGTNKTLTIGEALSKVRLIFWDGTITGDCPVSSVRVMRDGSQLDGAETAYASSVRMEEGGKGCLDLWVTPGANTDIEATVPSLNGGNPVKITGQTIPAGGCELEMYRGVSTGTGILDLYYGDIIFDGGNGLLKVIYSDAEGKKTHNSLSYADVYRITQSNADTAVSHQIKVQNTTSQLHIQIEGINAAVKGTSDTRPVKSPILVEAGCDVELRTVGENKVESAVTGVDTTWAYRNDPAIYVAESARLTFVGEGSLDAVCSHSSLYGGTAPAVIGGYAGQDSGTIIIRSGTVTAKNGEDLYGGAAIGGGSGSSGTVEIYGGTVTAVTDSEDAAGIGGGSGASGTVKIYGGRVTASSSTVVEDNQAAGIGGGNDAEKETVVEIHGGTITAKGTRYGAGIGEGGNGKGAAVTITGGSIQASSTGRGGAVTSPKNASGQPLKLAALTVKGVGDDVLVTASSGGYGVNDVYTRDGGKVYFYLPEGQLPGALMAGGKTYRPESAGSAIYVEGRPLYITAIGQTISYGGSIRESVSQVTAEGLLNGDSLESVTLTAQQQPVGVYDKGIVPSGAKILRNGQDVTGEYALFYIPGSLTVSAAPYTVKQWPGASKIRYGQTLADSALTGGDSGGSFAWRDGTVRPGIGGGEYEVVFTPEDSNYEAAFGKVSVAVEKAALTVTAKDQEITYGETIRTGADQAEAAPLAAGDYLAKVSLTAGSRQADDPDKRITPSEAVIRNAAGEDVTGCYEIAYADGSLTILPKTVDSPVIQLSADSVVFDGAEKKPAVLCVKDGGTLIQESEYTVGYEDNINVGTAAAVITDKPGGNYAVSGRAAFTIAPKPVTEAAVGVSGTFLYTGTAHVPDPLVILDGKTLEKDVDYTVGYENNIKAGTAKVTVTGTGNYSGSASGSFSIGKATLDIGAVTAEPLNDTIDGSQVILNRENQTPAGTLALTDSLLRYGTNTYTWKFTPDDTVNYEPSTGAVQITVNDTIPPSAEYRIGTDGWKRFINTITFGLFCKDYTTAEIQGTDDRDGITGSGIALTEYFLSDQVITDTSNIVWEAYTKPISLDALGKYFIYVRVTDNAGNVAVLNSEGIVVYAESTISPGTLVYTYRQNQDRTVGISLNGNTFRELTDQSGNVIAAGNYSISQDGRLTLKAAYLDTLDKGTYIYKAAVTPQGVATDQAELIYSFTVNVEPKELTVTGAEAQGRPYDGTKAVDIKAVTLSGVVSGDRVSVDISNMQGILSSADAGSYTAVTLPKLSLTGEDSENYMLVQPAKAVPASVAIARLDAEIAVGRDTYDKVFGDGAFLLDVKDNNAEADVRYEVTAGTDVVSVEGGTATIHAAGRASITVTLPQTVNYNAAESKTITVTVAKKGGYRAAALNRIYLYSRENRDSIDLAALLPKDCGAVAYGEPQVSGDVAYSTAPYVAGGKLSYAQGTGNAKDEGSITVTAATGNYEDFTITVNVKLTDRIPVKLKEGTDVTLENNVLTYGQPLSKLALGGGVFVDNDGNTVNGILAWKDPAAIPNAGTVSALWVFTPDDPEMYERAEGKTAITVTRAQPVVSAAPTVADRRYNPYEALKDSDLTGGKAAGVDGNGLDGTWSWQEAGFVPTVNNSGYTAVFMPKDTANYETVARTITVTVEKAVPYVAVFPTAEGITYGDALSASALTGGTVLYGNGAGQAGNGTGSRETVAGAFTWKEPSTKPAAADSGVTEYTAVFTPSDKANFDSVEIKVSLSVNKAQNAPDMPSSAMSVPHSGEKAGSVAEQPAVTEEGVMTDTGFRGVPQFTGTVEKLPGDGAAEPGDRQPGKMEPGDTEPGNGSTEKAGPEAGKPFIKGVEDKTGWDVIRAEEEKAQEGSAINVDMNGSTVVPGDIFDSIKGKDITITFDMGNGILWSVDGKSITVDQAGDIDFSVKTGENTIPVDIINNVTGESYGIRISLAYEGEFGLTAVLSIELGRENAGLTASLYYYNENRGELELICKEQIAEDGTASLAFTHASDYVIVIDKEQEEGDGAAQTVQPEETGVDGENETAAGESRRDGQPWQPWRMLAFLLPAAAVGAGIIAAARKKRREGGS